MAKRSGRPQQAHEEFVFEVGDPSLRYGVNLIETRYRLHPFEEDVSLEFTATCLYPDRFKGRAASSRLMGRRDYLARMQDSKLELPNGVASVSISKSRFEVWAECPHDACWQLGSAMSSGAIRYMLANAPVFVPKHSFINSLSFHGPGFDALGYIG